MRTLGILGGMSWESSAQLYKLLNREVAQRLGGLHSADVLMRSLNFAEVAALQRSGDWAGAALMLGTAGRALGEAGAQALLIATNTMHKVAEEVEAQSGLPLIHIVDATAAGLKAAGVRRAGLLATRYTMEEDFYRDRMRVRHDIELIVPEPEQRQELHRIIFEELCQGQVLAESRAFYLQTVQALAAQGAQGVILGCTEICLLLGPDTAAALPLFDSTALQARAAVEWMLGGTTDA
ncbi:aspartate/glutamate racemase family protein [Roseateles sp.]|uniref:aspartate/glutamate racemase family protein n=1 Tax=Roseateles sp. TaxID=1971397 RepID=UPI003BA52A46